MTLKLLAALSAGVQTIPNQGLSPDAEVFLEGAEPLLPAPLRWRVGWEA